MTCGYTMKENFLDLQIIDLKVKKKTNRIKVRQPFPVVQGF